MGRMKYFCLVFMLGLAPFGAALAGPPNGFWVPDLELTKARLSVADQSAMDTICRRTESDAFYVLSLLLVMEIDGTKLHMRGVGGGASQTAELQSEDSKSGKLLFRSAMETQTIEITQQPHGAMQVRWAGRENPELNVLQWFQKSNEEIARMDASLLAGNPALLEGLLKPCK